MLCVCDMCVLSLLLQTVVGSVDPSDAVLCVRLAASNGRANGGLCGCLGSPSPPVDPRSPFGAADLTPATARGKTNTLSSLENTRSEMLRTSPFLSFNIIYLCITVFFLLCFSCLIGG